MKTLAAVQQQIKAELRRPGDPDQVNFWVSARQAKAAIGAAARTGDERQVRAAAAAYGGLVKRWRRFLVELLTDLVMQQRDTSRGYVREWQQRVFGQAVASGRLAQYAKTERSGGGRPSVSEVPEQLERHVEELFADSKDKLKQLEFE